MADPGKGRGRGLAGLMQAMKMSQKKDTPPSSEDPAPEASPGPSVASSMVSSATASSVPMGRGQRAHAMLATQAPKPVVITPASDVKPSPASGSIQRGLGRGIKIFQLQGLTAAPTGAAASCAAPAETTQTTENIVESTVSTLKSSTAKNKYFKEIKDAPPVVRKGTSGRPCDVTSNFVYLNFEEAHVFEYEVRFDPEQDYMNVRFKLLNEHSQYFKAKTFDGTTLYVPHKLPDEATSLLSTNPYDNTKVQVNIIFRRTRRLSEMVHIYNVLFKQIMKDLELVRFGRQHFKETDAIQIPQHKLEVWPGYVTAVDEYEGGLMLTLDATHRVLRTQTALALIRDAARGEGAGWKRAAADALIGSSVMTTYTKKLYRIDAIEENMTPKSTFEKNQKGELVKISYIDYYKNNYGIDIMDWDQPMLISRESRRVAGSMAPTERLVCLVPELCQLTGLTDDQRSNFRLMKDVATYTRITPNQRHAAFKQYIQNVMQNERARNRLKDWGLSIAPETINITARTLAPEPIYFGNNIKTDGKPDAEWNAEISKYNVMQTVDILRWAVLYTDRDRQLTNDFVETMKRCSRPAGIKVLNPDLVRLPNDRTDAYIQGLRKTITSGLQLVVAICPTKRDDRYAAIKKICCADNPIPSQVINSRTISNQNKIRAITLKILLQINCKLGGSLWSIAIPYKTAMIVGVDSYHDGKRRQRSVCSFISSYNATMTQWYARAVFQDRGQELVDGLKACLVGALNHYLRANGRLPDRVVMYRDGVGDGELKVIRDYEIPQMQVCFSVLGETYKPTLTYVVVQKRINTRIFMKAGGGFENPHPGTVVDHDITRRDWYDFLIASQKVNQGTVTPTHYIVVYDDSGMTPDQCQRLTYKMCHLYYNWPGTIRVPAPCQYAHRLSYLIGQSVHEEPSEILADKLFFL